MHHTSESTHDRIEFVSNWSTTTPVAVVKPLTFAQRGTVSLGYIAAVVLGSVTLSLFSGSHLLFVALVLPVVIAMSWQNSEAMVMLLPIWLVMVGLLRRLTAGGGNVAFSGDPVIIVGPLALLILWLLVASKPKFGLNFSKLARTVFAFNVVCLLEAFNPAQHSLMTGVGGLLFIMIPSLAFWLGRYFGEEGLILRLVWTVAYMGLFAAAYGLYQQFHGFPTWDLNWIATKGYGALNLGSGVIRPFSTFSSAQEYAVFMAVALVAWVALLGSRTRIFLPLHVAAIVIISVALFYESQRTSLFLAVLALGVMGASRRGLRPLFVGLAGIGAVMVLIVFAGSFGGGGGGNTATSSSSAGSVAASHQLSGITDPTGANSSLPGHLAATRKGIVQGFTHPLGHGSGSVNLASSKYTSNNTLHGTEFDPGNMGIAFGVSGIIIYLMMLRNVLSSAYRLARERKDALGLFVIGLVSATLFQWTNGDLYSVCWLVWLFLGFTDKLAGQSAVSTGENTLARASQSFEWRRPGEPRRSSAAL
jgi:hypothetical protein